MQERIANEFEELGRHRPTRRTNDLDALHQLAGFGFDRAEHPSQLVE